MIDAAKLTGSHLTIIGNSGSGKSYAVRRLLEESWGQGVHIVFDGEDEFHTLRQARPYVLVNGEHADVRVSTAEAGALAEKVMREGISVIIQINSFGMEERQRFIAAFLDAMMALPRAAWRRALVVIDEADKYVPQGRAVASSQPIINLMAMGRKRGFVGVLATQRAAKINKNAVGEASNWMIGRVGQQNDRRVAADQLGFGIRSDEAEGLRTLSAGQFWTIGPAFAPGANLIQVDRSTTQHLHLGDHWAPEPLPAGSIPAVRRPAAGQGGPLVAFLAGAAGLALPLAGVIWGAAKLHAFLALPF